MELDPTTLRFAFGVVALTMLVLFYFVGHRATHSAYTGWWCAALSFYIIGSGAYILRDAGHQPWGNAVGNVLIAIGAGSAWGAARSLSGARTRWWQVTAAPALIGVLSFADDPTTNNSVGGLAYFAVMSAMSGLSAYALWSMDRGYTRTRTLVATAATVIFVFHLSRGVAFTVDGADGEVFLRYFGFQSSSVAALVFLVVISFTMTMLSNEQSTKELQIRADHDGLTGLLNRSEFLRLVNRETLVVDQVGAEAALILADLDHFKKINDTYGHQAGDRALQAFAQAATGAVRSSDLVGRYGGEEFIVFLPGASLDRAEQVTREISSMLSALGATAGFPMPTVSYGITPITSVISVSAAIESADTALYQAKALGRDQAVRNDRREPITRSDGDDSRSIADPEFR